MANFTIAQMQAVGVQPATVLHDLTSGYQRLDYVLDGSKRAIVATDTVEFWTIPALTGVNIAAAAVTIQKVAGAAGTVDIQLTTTDVTGLTAWSTNSTAGTQLVKLATAGNTAVATVATVLRLEFNTQPLAAGIIRVSVWLQYFVAPPSGL